MGLIDRFRRTRSDAGLSLAQYAGYLNQWDFTTLNFGGNPYPIAGLNQTMTGSKQEEIDHTFESFVQRVYKSNGIIFACMAAHLNLFTQARFQWQRMNGGVPGDLFGDASLAILERPWQNAVTGDLLARASQDADLAGNFYAARRGNRIKRMRPDWVTIVLGSESDPQVSSIDIDADVLGYIYHPGGKNSGNRPVALLADEVGHYAPIPDPMANFRGMSWLTPVIREVMGDNAATSHKLMFFENGATPNVVVKRTDSIGTDAFKTWVAMVEANHTGLANAYKTLYLDAGADATVLGSNFAEMDFKVTQGAGEVRIAAAAGVHPVILGISESLDGSSLNAGNFEAARRLYADLWARPRWSNLAASLETIVPAPGGARLWYDDRNIAFLAADQKDAAEIEQIKANTLLALMNAGWKADDAVKAVEAQDMGLLIGKHTGLFSVQLQAPGSTKMPAGEVPGESPVGAGSGPETVPAGDASTKPVTGGSVKPTNGTAKAPVGSTK